MLRELIRSEHVKNAIIFCNRKRDVAILLKSLLKHGFNAGALHGDMDQMSRTATLDAFREGRITLLAASDVAARGLDIPDVSHIFNFDVPWQSDDYVHRIGRTGRAGKEGRSLTLVTPDDVKQLKDIEKHAGRARHLDRRSAQRRGPGRRRRRAVAAAAGVAHRRRSGDREARGAAGPAARGGRIGRSPRRSARTARPAERPRPNGQRAAEPISRARSAAAPDGARQAQTRSERGRAGRSDRSAARPQPQPARAAAISQPRPAASRGRRTATQPRQRRASASAPARHDARP